MSYEKVARKRFTTHSKQSVPGVGERLLTKQPVSIRLSPEVMEYFKSTGKGWQTRMDEVLQDYVKTHR